ncbi:MAG: methylthioribulose 1-phosphate dehydratase [Myxococcota bacterium]
MSDPRTLICELCRQFYTQGWVSGTGGGISIREGDRVWMAPSGVQKERLQPEDLFELNADGTVHKAPPGDAKLSACSPLFFNAFRLRDAGAVLHSHSINAMLATLVFDREVRITHLEMMKGIRGHGYHDELVVPIIRNTAHECDLADTMAEAIEAYPKSQAVLVERHGVYVWGKDWVEAKTHAECYDYLFEAAVKMKQLGVDPSRVPAAQQAAE